MQEIMTTINQMNQIAIYKPWSGQCWPSTSMLLVLISIVFLTGQTIEAGGKGKGRTGHIIVQNEIKGNTVPVYMPIPIPIPMPMGPAALGPKFPVPHHHQQQQQSQDDGEGEVKKIYLLQPISKPQPQPNLKGGGFMGPVQTHIHLPGSMVGGPSKYRNSGGGGSHQAPFRQQFRQQHEGDSGHFEQQQQQQHSANKQGGDVKVLPIVVIPPIAPMPPIQVHSNQQQPIRMTPQFNNYVLSGSHERRKLRHLDNHGGGGRSHSQDGFSNYGGSVGGSIFRDNFASRSRPRSRDRLHPASHLTSAASSRSRDYDYSMDNSDYDGNSYPAGSSSSSSSLPSRSLNDLYRPSRRYKSGFSRHSRAHDGGRVNSIRDIVDQQQQASAQFDDDPINELSSGVVVEDDTSLRSRATSPIGSEFEIDSAEMTSRGRHLIRQSSEISLDELSSPQGAESLLRQSRQQQQDLSPLYYDREPEPQTASYQRTSSGRHGSSPGSDQQPSRPRWRSRLSAQDERDLLDEDEWRFDSIKSVQHANLNDTMTTVSNNSTSTAIQTAATSQPSPQ